MALSARKARLSVLTVECGAREASFYPLKSLKSGLVDSGQEQMQHFLRSACLERTEIIFRRRDYLNRVAGWMSGWGSLIEMRSLLHLPLSVC
jgi:hypothetical protein